MAQLLAPEDELARGARTRIEEMESPGHTFPVPMSRGDWIGAAVLIIVAGTLVVAGAWM